MSNKADRGKYSYSVVMTGYIGLEGTGRLAKKFCDEINARYPSYLAKKAAKFGGEDDKNAFERTKVLLRDHLESLHANAEEDAFFVEIREGGFLTGLYELANKSGLGFEVDLRKVPVLQETIEVCELLEVNPYHLYSGECMVCIIPEGGAFAAKLADEGINALIIGHTTDKKAHILHNDGTESHLNRPEPDELERFGLL